MAHAPSLVGGEVSYANKRLRVIDRLGLEASACECYAAIKEQFERLLSPTAN